jgi:hypothetical protein
LENKTLLSHVGASLVGRHLELLHKVQQEVQTVETGSAMAVNLTTNHPTYNPGQLVTMTLTMKNTSQQNETVLLGPSVDGFSITHNDKVIWRSNEGVEPQYIAKRIIKPGQSITLSAEWTVTDATGSFVVHNQMFPSVPVANFTVTTAPVSPTISRIPIVITPILPTPISPPTSPNPIPLT